MRRWTYLLWGLFLAAASTEATTIIAPESLGELALLSDAVVLGRALHGSTLKKGPLIFTRTDFVVEESLSGGIPALRTISVEVPGGEREGERWLVPGSPRFKEGASYLLFLLSGPEGVWRPARSSYGLLRRVAGRRGRELLVPLEESRLTRGVRRPGGVAAEPVGPCYYKERALGRLGGVLGGREAWSTAGVLAPVEELPEEPVLEPLTTECAFITTGTGRRYRWIRFDSAGIVTMDAAAPGGPSAERLRLLSEAMDLWMGIEGTRINLAVGSATSPTVVCTRRDDLEANVVLFDDPCADIANLRQCTGVLAFGGPLGTGTHQFNGETWATISGWAMVVNNGTECLGEDDFRVMLAHEMGHGLGYAHFEDPNALMYARCCNGVSSTDAACARLAYPGILAGNQRPAVSAGGGPRAVSGRRLRLRGAASDDGLPGALTTSWRQLHGPADAVLDDPSALDTVVTFPASGTYLLSLTAFDGELLRSDTLQLEVDLDAAPMFRRGDPNGDAEVDMGDVVAGLDHLFLGGSRPFCLKAIDFDDSGGVDLTDVVGLLTYLFLGGPPPEEPHGACGHDPTLDELACEPSNGCP